MILTDTKKSQAKTVIGLDSVAEVSVTSFKDGLFSLHLNEVSELCGCSTSRWRRWWASWGWGGLEVMRTRPLTLGLQCLSGCSCRGKNESLPHFFPLPKISSVGSRGDFLLVSEHVIELLTKMYQAVLDATQRQLLISVTEK